MSAEYRYLFCDLLTNEVQLEVPVYGVSFGRQLNKASDCTVSINLDRTGYSNSDVIGATVPGRTAFYIDREGGLVWGGIIWSRTYQSQAKALSYTGQSFESFFNKLVIEETLTYTNRDQRDILNELIIHAQSKGYTDIGIDPDPDYPFAWDATGTLRTVTFEKTDTWTYGKAIDYLVEYDQGLDYTIEVYYDEVGDPTKQLKCASVLGASIDNTGLVLAYPGNISNYYWPENASRAAVSVVGVGAGDGTDKLMTKSTDPSRLDLGYPDLQEIYSNTDVSVQDTLVTQTASEQMRLAPPITVPTIELSPQEEPYIGSWGLGDFAVLDIEDPRFEEGIISSVRIIGYTANPSSSDAAEACSLILEGDDAG
jgi:hypothetical protein